MHHGEGNHQHTPSAYAPFIDEDNAGGGVLESERLARRYFALFKRGELEEVLDLMHPEVEILLKSMRPGDVLRGRQDVTEFVDEISGKFYESIAEVFRPVDESRVIVEGRLRWMDDERVLRDDPMVWALEFRDGLLWRSTPAHSVIEAEAIFASASPNSAS